ncbi:thermonuclease family protein [Paenibacillus sp. ACRRX]|uniref:thermonuclease family protein n=1 Tax=unclassified Paenibacillus TaxID=185978 RepID=UPI001EF745C5|nr:MULTISPECIES: thermonuclease family protein [unclassified Paenibacillus]MCG7410019.1 thermonuclease family protein [Paenibacillus sp. ACRRX]MDK8182916.1 thermonuclease family protein [Paenibacillus sp. UMB4589-SE434]
MHHTNQKRAFLPSHMLALLVKYMIIPTVAAFLLAGCVSSTDGNSKSIVQELIQNYPELKGKTYESDTVQRVVDGDTFVTKSGHKVRLIGVNTPETHGKVQYYGKEASQFTKEQLTGKQVYLFSDTGNTDKYGRLLRYVFIHNHSQMFNETLVTEGYANAMTIPPNVMYAEHFVQLERKARKHKKGLWGSDKNELKPSRTPSHAKTSGH